MEYNSSRENLVISEYGRNIQMMVQHILTIEDREKRTKAATVLVNTMSMLQPATKEFSDYKQKLWHHLYTISDFKLDVDCPYPLPERKTAIVPEKVPYVQGDNSKYRYYGKNLEDIIDKAVAMEDSPAKKCLVEMIANTMKKLYLIWNKDTVEEDVIKEHLSELSGGALSLPEDFVFEDVTEMMKSKNKKVGNNQNNGQKKKNKFKKRNN